MTSGAALLLLRREFLVAGLLGRHEDLDLGQRERQEAEVLSQPAPGRQRVRGSLGNTRIVRTAAVGVAEKEEDQQGSDQQDIFYRSKAKKAL